MGVVGFVVGLVLGTVLCFANPGLWLVLLFYRSGCLGSDAAVVSTLVFRLSGGSGVALGWCWYRGVTSRHLVCGAVDVVVVLCLFYGLVVSLVLSGSLGVVVYVAYPVCGF